MSSLKNKFLIFSNLIVIITTFIITIICLKISHSNIVKNIYDFEKKFEKIEINNIKSQVLLIEKMLDDYLKGLTIIGDHLSEISNNIYKENKSQKLIILDKKGKILYDPETTEYKYKFFTVYFTNPIINKKLEKFLKNYYKGADFYFSNENYIIYVKSLKNFPYLLALVKKNVNNKFLSNLKINRELTFKRSLLVILLSTLTLIILLAILLQYMSRPYFHLVETSIKIFEDFSKGNIRSIDNHLKFFDKFNENEIKLIKEGFMKMKEGMGGLILNIKKMTTKVSSSANEIQNNLNNILEKLTESNKTMSEQLNNTEALSASIIEIEKAISEIKEYANSNRKISEENFNKALSGYNSIKNLMDWLNEISEFSKKIDDIIDIINEIAKKTKLLSLNASIEASKAGEHGKGFSIVAEEIRKLADTSSKSTEEIYDYLKNINSKISEGMNISKKIYQNLDEIKITADKNKKDSEKIAVAIEQQYSSITLISKNIIKYNEIAELNNKNFESIISSVEELELTAKTFSNMALELDNLMKSFKI